MTSQGGEGGKTGQQPNPADRGNQQPNQKGRVLEGTFNQGECSRPRQRGKALVTMEDLMDVQHSILVELGRIRRQNSHRFDFAISKKEKERFITVDDMVQMQNDMKVEFQKMLDSIVRSEVQSNVKRMTDRLAQTHQMYQPFRSVGYQAQGCDISQQQRGYLGQPAHPDLISRKRSRDLGCGRALKIAELPKSVSEPKRIVLPYLLLPLEKLVPIIRHQESYTKPCKLVGSYLMQDVTKYCHFHEQNGHATEHCYKLKELVKKLIEEGNLDMLLLPKDRKGKGIAQP